MNWLETADEQTIERVYSFLKRVGQRYWPGRPGDLIFFWSYDRGVIPVAAWADVETFVRWLLRDPGLLEGLFRAVLAGEAVNGEKFDVDNH